MHNTSDSLGAAIGRLLRPQLEELTAYVGLLLLTLGISAYKLASEGKIGLDTQGALASLGDAFKSAAGFLNGGDIWARLLLFGFWFIVGTLVYFLIWFLINISVDAYNDVVISTAFMHPRSFHQSQYWVAVVGRFVVQFLAGTVLLIYSCIALFIFLPAWTRSYQALFSTFEASPAISALGSAGIMLVMLHIGVILYRVTRLRAPA